MSHTRKTVHGPSLSPAPQEARTASERRPAYLRIAETLAERISQGVYPAGSRLPSGSQLCMEFDVSPMTARKALTHLKKQGLVSSIKGRGTFVRSLDISNSSFKLGSVIGEWLDSSAEIRPLSVSMARADESIATMLGIEQGQRVVCLRRLVLSGGSPAMYHTEYVVYDPLRPLLESQLHLTSLHAFLESDRGQPFPLGELTVKAMKLDATSAEALGEPEGEAALCLEHLFRDIDRQPVSWGRFLLRAPLFQLRAELGHE